MQYTSLRWRQAGGRNRLPHPAKLLVGKVNIEAELRELLCQYGASPVHDGIAAFSRAHSSQQEQFSVVIELPVSAAIA